MPNTTKRKKRMGALLSALATGGFFVVMGACILLLGLDLNNGAETVMILVCAVLYFAIAGGIALALNQRWKEIETGEEDEARKY